MRSAAVPAALVVLVTLAVGGRGAEGLGPSPYAEVLRRFVDRQARVDYVGLLAAPEGLDAFLATVAGQDRSELEHRPESERIAFWINAYNALTLRAIIDHYPIRPRGLARFRFPAASIRQVPGVWSRADHTVAGERISLGDIEHEVLRKGFNEPRIHVALVCAALGCPPLRREPYAGDRLDQQLDDQARRYLASDAGLRLDERRHRLLISEIFKWFGDDFAAYADRGAGLDGVEGFLVRYGPSETAAAIRDGWRRGWIDYDWTLNDQAAR